MKKLHFTKSWFLFAAVLIFPQMLFADQEMPNTSYVKASDIGGVYVKAYPADTLDDKGKTDVYRITDTGESLLCSLDWYADDVYLTDNFRMGGDSYALVRMEARGGRVKQPMGAQQIFDSKIID